MSSPKKSKVPKTPKESTPKETPTFKPDYNIKWPPIWAAAIVALGGVICYFVMNMFVPESELCVLTHVAWERNVFMEEWKQVMEEGWTVPSWGVAHKKEDRVETNTAIDGKEPVTEPYYFYTVYTWTPLESLIEKGVDTVPVWPNYGIDAYHRLNSTTETYTAFIDSKVHGSVNSKIKSVEEYNILRKEVGQKVYVRRESGSISQVFPSR